MLLALVIVQSVPPQSLDIIISAFFSLGDQLSLSTVAFTVALRISILSAMKLALTKKGQHVETMVATPLVEESVAYRQANVTLECRLENVPLST